MKNIVITGASSGIGAALVGAFAGDGHHVLACARRGDRLAAVTKDYEFADYAVVDVASEDQVKKFVDRVRDRFGLVDVLIHCAGSYGPIGLSHEVDSDAWLDALRTNLFGTYLMSKHIVPLMRPERRPRIINFSGGGAFQPLPRYSAYAVSKAGIVRLTETMAEELAPMGISVNGIAPGFVATEIHDATLAAGPEKAGEEFYTRTKAKLTNGAVAIEIPVRCVKFLISEAADGLTGKTISATFDPWGEPDFAAHIEDITASDLYTMQRINLVHIKAEPLSKILEKAALSKNAASSQGKS